MPDRIATLVSLAVLPVACTAPRIPEGRFACDTDADCPPGLVCRDDDGLCYSAAGTPDGGVAGGTGG